MPAKKHHYIPQYWIKLLTGKNDVFLYTKDGEEFKSTKDFINFAFKKHMYTVDDQNYEEKILSPVDDANAKSHQELLANLEKRILTKRDISFLANLEVITKMRGEMQVEASAQLSNAILSMQNIANKLNGAQSVDLKDLKLEYSGSELAMSNLIHLSPDLIDTLNRNFMFADVEIFNCKFSKTPFIFSDSIILHNGVGINKRFGYLVVGCEFYFPISKEWVIKFKLKDIIHPIWMPKIVWKIPTDDDIWKINELALSECFKFCFSEMQLAPKIKLMLSSKFREKPKFSSNIEDVNYSIRFHKKNKIT